MKETTSLSKWKPKKSLRKKERKKEIKVSEKEDLKDWERKKKEHEKNFENE